MVLFLKEDNEIYAYNKRLKKEDIEKYQDAIWYEGDFDFLDGKDKEGYAKLYRWNGEKPILEYEPMPVPEPTINEKIYEAVSKSQDEIRQEGADMVMEELVKRGLIV